jgi:polysaccharide deacetylase family protein (PEP-CTERM system associated)
MRATFFVLGWLAERLPHLVREIHSRGHEVASHGYSHELCYKQSDCDLKEDLARSKKLLEDIIGGQIYGYRAPSFSINDEILEVIKETGYLYDSSFNSFRLHGRYGSIKLNGNGTGGILHQISDKFYEIPISNIKIGGRILPWGGGGYFRLIPLAIFKSGIQSILKKSQAYLFYLHPWEIDSDQPRVSDVPGSFKFRHYVNLNKTYFKLSRLLACFNHYQFSTCFRYVSQEAERIQEPH